MAMNFVANGIPIAAGDEILTTDQEHPGGIGPWQCIAKRRGATVKTVAIGDAPTKRAVLDAFAAGMTPRTRVVWASHLTSSRGILLPAKEIVAMARDARAISIIDGAQVIGQLVLDVHDIGCDYYVTSPHKWLCAPKGT